MAKTKRDRLEPEEAYRLMREGRVTELEDPHNRDGGPDRVWYFTPDGVLHGFDGLLDREYPEFRIKPFRKAGERDADFEARLAGLRARA